MPQPFAKNFFSKKLRIFWFIQKTKTMTKWFVKLYICDLIFILNIKELCLNITFLNIHDW